MAKIHSIVFDDPAEFYRTIPSTILSEESAHSLFLGIAYRLANSPGAFGSLTPYQAHLYSDDSPILSLQRTPPYNLQLARANGKIDESVMTEIVRLVYSHDASIPGVIGEREVVTHFAEAWLGNSNSSWRVRMSEGVNELRDVTFPVRAAGAMRIATAADAPLLIDWFHAFRNETGQQDPPIDVETVRTKINSGDLFVWQESSVVSMAARARKTENGICINFVYTPREHRGRGFASNLVAHLSEHLLREGNKFCALFTDLSNPTSNGIYRKIGYKKVCEFLDGRFGI